MKVLIILSIALILLGCTNKEHPKTTEISSKLNYRQGNIIFEKLLKAFNQCADEVVNLFDSEANIEFPYARALGTPSKLNLNAYYNYLKVGLPKMPDIKFEKLKLYKVDKGAYWAEVRGSALIPSTGKLYIQNYVMYFTLKENKISFYKEYWNPVAAMEAFGNQDTIKEIFNTHH